MADDEKAAEGELYRAECTTDCIPLSRAAKDDLERLLGVVLEPESEALYVIGNLAVDAWKLGWARGASAVVAHADKQGFTINVVAVDEDEWDPPVDGGTLRP